MHHDKHSGEVTTLDSKKRKNSDFFPKYKVIINIISKKSEMSIRFMGSNHQAQKQDRKTIALSFHQDASFKFDSK